MDMNIATEGDKAVFTLSGRLDTVTSPVLEKELVSALEKPQNVVLDFSGISYISSAGLRTLLIAQKKAVGASVHMWLRGVNDDVMEILTMTGFDTLLEFMA